MTTAKNEDFVGLYCEYCYLVRVIELLVMGINIWWQGESTGGIFPGGGKGE